MGMCACVTQGCFVLEIEQIGTSGSGTYQHSLVPWAGETV